MNKEEIRELFIEVINRKSASKIEGMTKFKLYEYRNRKEPNLGTMLEVLIAAKEITIVKNEPEAK